MPIYEYECKDCGRQFEWLTRSDETPECPACGRTNLTRQISAPAAHSGNTAPACPAQPSCGMSNCCGGQCGLGNFMGG